jgi:hypothetical protein
VRVLEEIKTIGRLPFHVQTFLTNFFGIVPGSGMTNDIQKSFLPFLPIPFGLTEHRQKLSRPLNGLIKI